MSAPKCLECHDEVAGQVKSRRGFHADKGSTCLPCHLDHRGRGYRMVQFDDVGFDHQTTGFPLRGGHADVPCAECHQSTGPTGRSFTGLDRGCEGCHDDPHGSAGSTRALTGTCTSCHTDSTWSALPLAREVFDHQRTDDAAYPLEGAHADARCDSCHAKWRFVPTAHEACTTCHEPPHRAPFSQDCATCHTIRADWKVARFDHLLTGYPLEGMHREVPCQRCHTRGVLRPLPHAACTNCHKDPHRGQFAPRPCDECHSVNRAGFAVSEFDHAAVGWPLEGKHAETACSACHGVGPEATYEAVSTACADCHDDAHGGRFAPSPCEECHAPSGWPVAAFDHSRTPFPLVGQHADLPCAECHPPHLLAPIPHQSCADCHTETPHDETVASSSCAGCHTPRDWAALAFDHGAQTPFPLEPQHSALPCGECHEAARFVGLDPECAECHADDEPTPHFSGACGDCHVAAHWPDALLAPAAHAETGFALTASHSRLACGACHAPGRPKGATPTECSACHASDDVHRHMLGDVCGDCHTESTWFRTRWRHQLTGWPLHGAHRLASCDGCHAAGYAGTPADCRSCHLAEAPASVPAHQSADFASCDLCHRPYNWAVLAFPH